MQEVIGSSPLSSTSKALSANTAGKAFLLVSLGFSCVTLLVARSSSTSDEMTANDTDCPLLPEFGATGGATKLFPVAPADSTRRGFAAASWLSVPVARIAARSVNGDGFRSRDGSASSAP